MRKRSKSILAIVLAASVMSGTWSLPTVAADFSSEELLEVEDQESDSEEEFFTEDNDWEETEDIEENRETSSEVGIQEEPVETCTENESEQSETGIPAADFTDEDTADVGMSGDYGVKVAGIWVTSENKDNILGMERFLMMWKTANLP